MASKFTITAELNLQTKNLNQVVNNLKQQFQGANLNIKIKDLAKAQSQINGITKATGEARASFNSLGGSIATAAKKFSVITLATGTLVGLTRGIKNAVGDAIEFEREMVKIAQATGKTVSQLKGLEMEVGRIATTMGASSKELLLAARTLTQAGFAADKVTGSLKILAQTELAATFDSIADTTEGIIALLNQFGKQAQQTGNEVAFLEKSLSAINQVSKEFAVESSDLITAIRTSGSAFEAAGGSLDELIALFTSVRSTTRESAESIATGFRTIFTRVQRVDTINQLRALGIELQDATGKFVGPMEAAKRLSAALNTIDPRDFRFNLIVEQLGGFRQVSKVIPLIQQFSVAQRALSVAQGASGSLAKDAATAQQSLGSQIQKTREEFSRFIREFTQTSSFQGTVRTLLDMASAFLKVADTLKPLIPLIAGFAAIKVGQALGSSFLSFAGGLNKKAQGGKIHKFASGGMVPGSGNGDTVPAMLTPGEFVIRKSSVKKLGAENLAHANKYASGGLISNLGGKKGSDKAVSKTRVIKGTTEIGLANDKYYTKGDIGQEYLNIGKIKEDKDQELQKQGYNYYIKSPSAKIAKAGITNDQVKNLLKNNKKSADVWEEIVHKIYGGNLRRENGFPVDITGITGSKFSLRDAKYKPYESDSEEDGVGKTLSYDLKEAFPDKYNYAALNQLQFEPKDKVKFLGKSITENLDEFRSKNTFAFTYPKFDFSTTDLNDLNFSDIVSKSNAKKIKFNEKKIQDANAELAKLDKFESNLYRVRGTTVPTEAEESQNKKRETSRKELEGTVSYYSDSTAKINKAPKTSIIKSKKLDKEFLNKVSPYSPFKDQVAKSGGGLIQRFALGGPAGKSRAANAITIPKIDTYSFDKAAGADLDGTNSKKQQYKLNAEDRLDYNLNTVNVDVDKLKVSKDLLERYRTGDDSNRGFRFEDILLETGMAKSLSMLSNARLDGITKDGDPFEAKSRKTAISASELEDKLYGAIVDSISEPEKLARARFNQNSLTENEDHIKIGGVTVFEDVTRGLGAAVKTKARMGYAEEEAAKEAKVQGKMASVNAQQSLQDLVKNNFGSGFIISGKQYSPITEKGNLHPDVAANLNQALGGSYRDQMGSPAQQAKVLGLLKTFIVRNPVQKKANGGLIADLAWLASGGAASGTDTVPAMLTPGEYVINKKSAQAIGYGSLNRMNKVGKFANGGPVGVQYLSPGGRLNAAFPLPSTSYGSKVTAAGNIKGSSGAGAGAGVAQATKIVQQSSNDLKEAFDKIIQKESAVSSNLVLMAGVISSVTANMSGMDKESIAFITALTGTFAAINGVGQSLKGLIGQGVASALASQKQTKAVNVSTGAFAANAAKVNSNTAGGGNTPTGQAAPGETPKSLRKFEIGMNAVEGTIAGFAAGVAIQSARAAMDGAKAEKEADKLTKAMEKFSNSANNEVEVRNAMIATLVASERSQARTNSATGGAALAGGAVGGLAGGVVGGAIGTAIGGPAVTAIGAQIGSSIGSTIGTLIGSESANKFDEKKTTESANKLATVFTTSAKAIKDANKYLEGIDKQNIGQVNGEFEKMSKQLSMAQQELDSFNAKDLETASVQMKDQFNRAGDTVANFEQTMSKVSGALMAKIGKEIGNATQLGVNYNIKTTGPGKNEQLSKVLDIQQNAIAARFDKKIAAASTPQEKATLEDQKATELAKNAAEINLTFMELKLSALQQSKAMIEEKAAREAIVGTLQEENALRTMIERFAFSLEKAARASDNIDAAFSGTVSGLKSSLPDPKIFDLKSPDTAEFQSALDVVAKIGPIGQKLATNLADLNKVTPNFEETLLNIQIANPSDIQQTVKDVITKGFKIDLGSDVGKALEEQMVEALTNKQTGANEDSVTPNIQDPETIKKLKDQIESYAAAMKESAKGVLENMASAEQEQKAIIDKIVAAEQRKLDLQMQMVDSYERLTSAIAKATGRGVSLAEKNAMRSAKLFAVLGADAGKSIPQIGAKLKDLRNQLQAGIKDPEKLGKVVNQANRLEQALKTLANQSDRTSDTLEAIDKIKAQREAVTGAASGYAFSNNEGRKSKDDAAAALQQVMAAGGDLDAVSEEMRPAVEGLLGELGEAGAQVKKQLAANFYEKRGQTGIANMIRSESSTPEQALIRELRNIYAEEITAQAELMKQEQNFQDKQITALNLVTLQINAYTGTLKQIHEEAMAKAKAAGEAANPNGVKPMTIDDVNKQIKLLETGVGNFKGMIEGLTKTLGEINDAWAKIRDAKAKPPVDANPPIGEARKALNAAAPGAGLAGLPQRKAKGGLIYRADGGSIFQPKGTDTVPAMLTPGEFVIKKSSVDKIGTDTLSAINNGYADGGLVSYLQRGGQAGWGNMHANETQRQNDEATRQMLANPEMRQYLMNMAQQAQAQGQPQQPQQEQQPMMQSMPFGMMMNQRYSSGGGGTRRQLRARQRANESRQQTIAKDDANYFSVPNAQQQQANMDASTSSVNEMMGTVNASSDLYGLKPGATVGTPTPPAPPQQEAAVTATAATATATPPPAVATAMNYTSVLDATNDTPPKPIPSVIAAPKPPQQEAVVTATAAAATDTGEWKGWKGEVSPEANPIPEVNAVPVADKKKPFVASKAEENKKKYGIDLEERSKELTDKYKTKELNAAQPTEGGYAINDLNRKYRADSDSGREQVDMLEKEKMRDINRAIPGADINDNRDVTTPEVLNVKTKAEVPGALRAAIDSAAIARKQLEENKNLSPDERAALEDRVARGVKLGVADAVEYRQKAVAVTKDGGYTFNDPAKAQPAKAKPGEVWDTTKQSFVKDTANAGPGKNPGGGAQWNAKDRAWVGGNAGKPKPAEKSTQDQLDILHKQFVRPDTTAAQSREIMAKQEALQKKLDQERAVEMQGVNDRTSASKAETASTLQRTIKESQAKVAENAGQVTVPAPMSPSRKKYQEQIDKNFAENTAQGQKDIDDANSRGLAIGQKKMAEAIKKEMEVQTSPVVAAEMQKTEAIGDRPAEYTRGADIDKQLEQLREKHKKESDALIDAGKNEEYRAAALKYTEDRNALEAQGKLEHVAGSGPAYTVYRGVKMKVEDAKKAQQKFAQAEQTNKLQKDYDESSTGTGIGAFLGNTMGAVQHRVGLGSPTDAAQKATVEAAYAGDLESQKNPNSFTDRTLERIRGAGQGLGRSSTGLARVVTTGVDLLDLAQEQVTGKTVAEQVGGKDYKGVRAAGASLTAVENAAFGNEETLKSEQSKSGRFYGELGGDLAIATLTGGTNLVGKAGTKAGSKIIAKHIAKTAGKTAIEYGAGQIAGQVISHGAEALGLDQEKVGTVAAGTLGMGVMGLRDIKKKGVQMPFKDTKVGRGIGSAPKKVGEYYNAVNDRSPTITGGPSKKKLDRLAEKDMEQNRIRENDREKELILKSKGVAQPAVFNGDALSKAAAERAKTLDATTAPKTPEKLDISRMEKDNQAVRDAFGPKKPPVETPIVKAKTEAEVQASPTKQKDIDAPVLTEQVPIGYDPSKTQVTSGQSLDGNNPFHVAEFNKPVSSINPKSTYIDPVTGKPVNTFEANPLTSPVFNAADYKPVSPETPVAKAQTNATVQAATVPTTNAISEVSPAPPIKPVTPMPLDPVATRIAKYESDNQALINSRLEEGRREKQLRRSEEKENYNQARDRENEKLAQAQEARGASRIPLTPVGPNGEIDLTGLDTINTVNSIRPNIHLPKRPAKRDFFELMRESKGLPQKGMTNAASIPQSPMEALGGDKPKFTTRAEQIAYLNAEKAAGRRAAPQSTSRKSKTTTPEVPTLKKILESQKDTSQESFIESFLSHENTAYKSERAHTVKDVLGGTATDTGKRWNRSFNYHVKGSSDKDMSETIKKFVNPVMRGDTNNAMSKLKTDEGAIFGTLKMGSQQYGPDVLREVFNKSNKLNIDKETWNKITKEHIEANALKVWGDAKNTRGVTGQELIHPDYKSVQELDELRNGYASGGLVSYLAKGGSTDTIPAMLTPGEFVMSKGAVDKNGKAFMEHLNRGGTVKGFANGGEVSYLNRGGGPPASASTLTTIANRKRRREGNPQRGMNTAEIVQDQMNDPRNQDRLAMAARGQALFRNSASGKMAQAATNSARSQMQGSVNNTMGQMQQSVNNTQQAMGGGGQQQQQQGGQQRGGGQQQGGVPNMDALGKFAESFSGFTAQLTTLAETFKGLTVNHTVTFSGQINIGGFDSANVAKELQAGMQEWVKKQILDLAGTNEANFKQEFKNPD